MVTRNEAFPSHYLQSADVKKAPGGRLVDTIEYVKMEKMQGRDGQSERSKPVVYLGNNKPFVCNATNWNTIADTLGDESDDWTGGKVALVVKRVQMGREMVDGIRVDAVRRPGDGKAAQGEPEKPQPPRPGNNTPAPKASEPKRGELDDEIPF
jgi:hypothetical protein